METTLERPVEKTEAVHIPSLILSQLPRHGNLTPVVHLVCGSYYRVNFHDVTNENYIAQSYFVEVLGKKISYTAENSWKTLKNEFDN